MTTYYLQSGSTVRVVGNADSIRQALSPATYVVKQDLSGYFLDQIPDMNLPEKLYGDVNRKAERIINTFESRGSNTGVLLSGEKGSGKTMLTKLVSAMLRKQNIPTILVNSDFCGEGFNTFITSITDSCLIIFDEFEKIYDMRSQEEILSLLDGTFNNKKLFMFTCNNGNLLSEYLFNRPGRIYYNWDFKGLDTQFVHEYASENLKNSEYLQDVVDLATMFSNFNFDMLKAVVEEMNRYDEPVREVLKHLNINPRLNALARHDATVISYGPNDDVGKGFDQKVVEVFGDDPFNPMYNNFWVDVEYTQTCDDGENMTKTFTYYFVPDDLVEYSRKGTFVFRHTSGTVIELERVNKKDLVFYQLF